MPEARDRLSRPTDYENVIQLRRSDGVLSDEPDSIVGLFGSPVQRLSSSATTGLPTRFQDGGGSVLRGRQNRRSRLGVTTGSSRGRYVNTSPYGRENIPAGSGRRRRVLGVTRTLPNWYPRTPLRDISAIVRAIERRRARLGDTYGSEIVTATPQGVGVLDSDLPVSGAQLEHSNMCMITPKPSVQNKKNPPSTARVHKMLLDITKQSQQESELLTPQKKLLNSIHKVEKAVMEEIQKLKSTPSAKKAERQKKVRTLMSMR